MNIDESLQSLPVFLAGCKTLTVLRLRDNLLDPEATLEVINLDESLGGYPDRTPKQYLWEDNDAAHHPHSIGSSTFVGYNATRGY